MVGKNSEHFAKTSKKLLHVFYCSVSIVFLLSFVVKQLQNLHLFRNVSAKDLTKLTQMCQILEFRPRQVIFAQNAPADHAMVPDSVHPLLEDSEEGLVVRDRSHSVGPILSSLLRGCATPSAPGFSMPDPCSRCSLICEQSIPSNGTGGEVPRYRRQDWQRSAAPFPISRS